MEYLLMAIPVAFLVGSVYVAYMAVKKGKKRTRSLAMQIASFCVVGLACMLGTVFVSAASGDAAAATDGLGKGLSMLAAALSTGIAGIGGGIAVANAAPAAIGATSEDPKAFGKALIFVALGEGIALYGLLISILIISNA
ncbi:MAG: ATP synthase subunit C [Acutalibacteraceae bacterium]